jgi:hypothetical protein
MIRTNSRAKIRTLHMPKSLLVSPFFGPALFYRIPETKPSKELTRVMDGRLPRKQDEGNMAGRLNHGMVVARHVFAALAKVCAIVIEI